MKSITLASTSIYRKKLLESLHLTFECLSPSFDEDSFDKNSYATNELSLKLAQLKAQSLENQRPQNIIIGSDQVIYCENKILSKPKTKEKAIQQLQFLRGKTHHLSTGVCLLSSGQSRLFQVEAQLKVRSDLSDSEIERYIDKDDPLWCAGSYKLESLGISLFEKIECSDFTSIVGLPLIQTSHELRKLGIQIP